jgi:hypothetical protein
MKAAAPTAKSSGHVAERPAPLPAFFVWLGRASRGVKPPGRLPSGLTPQYTPKRRGVPHLVDDGQETPPEVKAFVARMMRPP